MAECVPKEELGGFLPNIAFEIIQSPLNIALVIAIAFLAYKMLKRSQTVPTYPPEPQLPKLRRDFTVEELKKFDGTQEDGRGLIAVNGNVYDDTRSKMFYGPGGSCSAFAGRDASRGLATVSVACKTDGYDDLSHLNSVTMKAVREWEAKFKGGNLLGAGPMQSGTPTVRAGATALNDPGNTMRNKQALQQLLQNLRSPQSPHEQQYILHMLKSNPRLMAAFIKRQAQFQAQQYAGAGVAGASPQ